MLADLAVEIEAGSRLSTMRFAPNWVACEAR
jgi:hypothetical protein